MPGLRELAEADLALTVEDATGGFGWATTLIDPDDAEAPMVGLNVNTMLLGDPDTGVAVQGRRVSQTVRISSLPDPLVLPEGIPDENVRPWRFRFTSLQGAVRTWRVTHTDPDETLGIIVCHLEPWTES